MDRCLPLLSGTWTCLLLMFCGGVSSAFESDRSPVDLVITPDERWLVSANQTANTLSLVDLATDRVVHEVDGGTHPTGLALLAEGRGVLATAAWSGELRRYKLADGQLLADGVLTVGYEPHSVVATRDGQTAYVSLAAAAEVAEIDLASFSVRRRLAVGAWPRQMALSPDESRLAVATSGNQSVSVLDLPSGELAFQNNVGGINLGQLQMSADGAFVYLPWMVYRQYPVTASNIRRGWVLASRIGRIRMGEQARRQAISLDVPGLAVSDPHGLALSSDEQWLVASAGGTHELLVYRTNALNFQDYGGPGDLIDGALARDRNKFYRIELGGRPLNIRMAADDRHVYVANYLLNAVQVVDLSTRQVARTIALGGPDKPSLARQGEAIFYDGRRSLDQWYSCQTCHYEGGTNAVVTDTRNDGMEGTHKTILPLHFVGHTAPWTWHGWQHDLGESLRKSLVDSMLGPQPSADDVNALLAYLETLDLPPNPHVAPDGQLSAAQQRGKLVFQSEKAGCATCHTGPYLTDGQIHDVGLTKPTDVYQGYNTPMLRGLYRRVRFLHDGRARSLNDVLTGAHDPDLVTGLGKLSEPELADLIEYLKTL